MEQYNKDSKRFVELFSKFTGIRNTKVSKFLVNSNIGDLCEHSTALNISDTQLENIKSLKELSNLYSNLKSNYKAYTMNSSIKSGEYFVNFFKGMKEKEMFVCAFLDNQNNIIHTEIVSKGTVNTAPVYPREITKLALQYDANSVILSHNHPGGSLDPSNQDKTTT